jgi:DNA-binding transcriptional LysR family regulator
VTLQQLRYAIGVAASGSFNEAAERLYISQPSLSQAVRELEKDVGIQIFARTNRGVSVTVEGAAFLGYARQVLEQADLLESHYKGKRPTKRLFSVTTQHYAFAVNAFVDLIKKIGEDEYECTLRETRTWENIDDVRNLRSEIGVLYVNAFNEKVLRKLFTENSLEFTSLFTARPHVFVSARHPLAKLSRVSLQDLEEWPYLSFEQGEHNSFYFSEEIQSTLTRKKTVKVSDRATLFNLLIGLHGYTISTGILTKDLNGNKIVSIPLDVKDDITVGYVTHKTAALSSAGATYVELLKKYCSI